MIHRFGRSFAIVAATGIVLAACGGASGGSDNAAQPASPGSALPAAPATTPDAAPIDTTASEATAAPVEATDAPAGTDAPADAAEVPADTEAPVESAPATDAPAQAPVAEAQVGGRALAEAVAPESDIASNQLPDVVVDDIRRGTKVNFRNLVPADRPILLWMWAPH